LLLLCGVPCGVEVVQSCVRKRKAAGITTTPSPPQTIKFLLAEAKGFLAAYETHARHEDAVLFPAVRAVFPGVDPAVSREHE
jgi:ribosomal protein S12 methylthiotransferase accessory factor YcaO